MRTVDTHLAWADDGTSDSGTTFILKFSHHALVLPFLTQQDLRTVVIFANSSFFLTSRFSLLLLVWFIALANISNSVGVVS